MSYGLNRSRTFSGNNRANNKLNGINNSSSPSGYDSPYSGLQNLDNSTSSSSQKSRINGNPYGSPMLSISSPDLHQQAQYNTNNKLANSNSNNNRNNSAYGYNNNSAPDLARSISLNTHKTRGFDQNRQNILPHNSTLSTSTSTAPSAINKNINSNISPRKPDINLNRSNSNKVKSSKTSIPPQPVSIFESILNSIVQDKYISQRKFNRLNPNNKFSLKNSNTWLEYYNLNFDQYTQLNNRVLQRQELMFQLIKYLRNNSKIDKKNIWNNIGYEFLFKQDDDLIIFPESKQEVYNKFFGYFNSLQHLEELTEKFLYLPLISELRKNEDMQKLSNFKFFNINNVCMIFDTWIFKIIDAYQLYINQLIVARFWLDMEKFKTFNSSKGKAIKKQQHDFFEWLKLKTDFNYNDLISNYLITNLQNYTLFFEKLLFLNSSRKSSTTYKKIAIVANSLKTFSNQCKTHYSTIEFKNILTRFFWDHDIITGNLDLRWKNMKLLRHDKINNSSKSIDYLLLFNNCLVFCKLDIYLKQFIINEFPLPIEFIDILPSSFTNNQKLEVEAKLIHTGKSLTYKLKFRDINLRDNWIKVIKETKYNFIKESLVTYPLILKSVAGNNSQQPSHASNNDSTEEMLLTGITDLSFNNENDINSSSVNGRIYCSATIDYNRQQYNIIGTSNGLFIDDINRTGLNWKKLSGIRNIRQIKFLPEYSSLLVLTEEQIVLFDFNNIIKSIVNTNFHLVGRNISNNEKVYFFKLGNINNDLYIIYRYAKNNNNIQGFNNPNDSYFKVFRMNPQKRDFELIQSFELNDIDCYDIVLLNDTIDMVYISSNQGFFKLFLRKISLSPLQIFPSYGFNSREFISMDQRIFLQKIKEIYLPNSNPIKILETGNNNELILIFDKFAIFIDKTTNLISQWDIVNFNCQVRDASFKDGYLFVLSNNYIEVFEITDNLTQRIRYLSHKQVIKAPNVALVDSMSANISVVMDHPLQGNQIVIHLIKKNNIDTSFDNDDEEDEMEEEDDDEGDEDQDYESINEYASNNDENQMLNRNKYLQSKRDSRVQIKATDKKFMVGSIKMIGSKVRLPSTWSKFWNLNRNDLNSIDPDFLNLQETLYSLVKNEEMLISETSKLHRTIGFSFLSSSFDDVMNKMIPAVTYNKDVIFKHTFGCLIPLISYHENFLLNPMLEILNHNNENIPMNAILSIFSKWINEASEVYTAYADRLIQSEFFFETEKLKDLITGNPMQQGSTLLNKLGCNLQFVQDTSNRYIDNLITLNNIFQKLSSISQYNNDNNSISSVGSTIRNIVELHDSVTRRLKHGKFQVISREISWDLNGKSSILEEFYSHADHEILKISECFLQIADANKYVHNKKRMIMLFADWILLIKIIPDDYNNSLHVSEEPLHLSRFVYQVSKSDSNTINFFNHQGRLLFKICFSDLQEWYGLINFSTNR